MPRGNIGEWSEFYTFLKLLADGRIYAGDQNLNKKENLFYVTEIENLEFLRDQSIVIQNGQGQQLSTIPVQEIIRFSQRIFEGIRSSSRGERAFEIANSTEILEALHVSNLSDNTQDKSDIRIVIHDPITQFEPLLGFSIKSYLGSRPTLFNASKLTNIIYTVVGNISSTEFTAINGLSTYTERIRYLKRNNFHLEHYAFAADNFKSNLELIDSRLPEILSYIVLYKYWEGRSNLDELVQVLTQNNPCGFLIEQNPNFYSYKIKRLLTDVALGMTPRNIWTGIYHATGGYIVVKSDGDLVCFHIYNWNEFQEYLLNRTKIESPDSSPNRCDFGRLLHAEEIGTTDGIYIKLNFQVRFR